MRPETPDPSRRSVHGVKTGLLHAFSLIIILIISVLYRIIPPQTTQQLPTMFTLHSFESMPSLAFDPLAGCPPSARGCRSQARPSCLRGAMMRQGMPMVCRAPAPVPPVELSALDRVRIIREKHSVVLLIEIPGFSKEDIK